MNIYEYIYMYVYIYAMWSVIQHLPETCGQNPSLGRRFEMSSCCWPFMPEVGGITRDSELRHVWKGAGRCGVRHCFTSHFVCLLTSSASSIKSIQSTLVVGSESPTGLPPGVTECHLGHRWVQGLEMELLVLLQTSHRSTPQNSTI